MARAYISLLTTDSYLPGVLALAHSIRATASRYPIVVLVAPRVSEGVRLTLSLHSIQWLAVSEIVNPTNVSKTHRWHPTYTKLRVFGLAQYDKVVFLDADILCLKNIDALFECDHMSGVSSGSKLPECATWTNVNSGLLVISPSSALFDEMVRCVGRIEVLSSGGSTETPRAGSDQDFINAYYPDWAQNERLHLDHKYNMLHYHLDRYHELFGYHLDPPTNQVSVVHFASFQKPWDLSEKVIERIALGSGSPLEDRALRLWGETYTQIHSSTGLPTPSVRCFK